MCGAVVSVGSTWFGRIGRVRGVRCGAGLTGFLVSTAIIVVFAEILPQAACSRHALRERRRVSILRFAVLRFTRRWCVCARARAGLGSRLVPLMKVLVILFYPIAKPLALVLDLLLGEEIGTFYTKQEVPLLPARVCVCM